MSIIAGRNRRQRLKRRARKRKTKDPEAIRQSPKRSARGNANIVAALPAPEQKMMKVTVTLQAIAQEVHLERRKRRQS